MGRGHAGKMRMERAKDAGWWRVGRGVASKGREKPEVQQQSAPYILHLLLLPPPALGNPSLLATPHRWMAP